MYHRCSALLKGSNNGEEWEEERPGVIISTGLHGIIGGYSAGKQELISKTSKFEPELDLYGYERAVREQEAFETGQFLSITTINVYLLKSKKYTRSVIMQRHERIEQLFDEKFWVAH